MTGDPATLVEALDELDGEATSAPTADKRRAYEGVRGLCFLPLGFNDDSGDEAAQENRFYVVAHSHPPTAARIERLKSVASSN